MRGLLFSFFTILVIQGYAQNELRIEPALSILQQFDKIRDLTMNRAATEAYFTIQSPNEEVSVIAKSMFSNGDWEFPSIAAFSGIYKDLEPFLSPNGRRLYFVSNRPLNDSSTAVKDFDIWYVERASTDSPWSNPTNMGAPINTEHNEFYPAIAKNGNLYYTCDCPNAMGRDDIYFSAYVNGKYTAPTPLDENINSEGFEYNAFISEDDSYLIFGGYNREDGQGSGDMYISFKDASGKWSRAIPLPSPINSKYMDYCPFVDEQQQTIYFTSRRSLTPAAGFDSTSSLSIFLDSYENGNSRLYKAKIDIRSLNLQKQE